MPAVGFTKPGQGGKLSFEEAPEWYAQNTEVPAEAIALIAYLEQDSRRYGQTVTPSGACEDTTCLRQQAIKRFLKYLINGISSWQATEGTAWHYAFERAVPTRVDEDDWHREVLLPRFFVGKTTANVEKDPLSDSHAVEIFPGLWTSGKLDKLKTDFTEIEDFKTQAWAGYREKKTGLWKVTHYPPKEDNVIQLNMYRRMVEVCTRVNPSKLTIRRMYRGARDAQQAWKKFDVRVMSNDELEATIRPFMERAAGIFGELRDIVLSTEDGPERQEKLVEVISKLPLDGKDKRMLGNQKCTLYCTQRPICYKMAGLVGFEDEADSESLLEIT